MGSATSYCLLPGRQSCIAGRSARGRMIAAVRALAQYAYFWRGRVLVIAVTATVVAGIGSSAVFDRVKPFGFQDPASDSSRVNERLEAATGQRVLPDVVLLVESAHQSDDELRAAAELRSIPEVTRTVTPAEDPNLVAEDGRSAAVLGFLDADTDDVPAVGEVVRERFAGDPEIAVGGAAVTASRAEPDHRGRPPPDRALRGPDPAPAVAVRVPWARRRPAAARRRRGLDPHHARPPRRCSPTGST